MQRSIYKNTESNGTFSHLATCSFYGTEINPPLPLEVHFEMHRGRPVFREAIDPRGQSHEIELLNQSDLRRSFEEAVQDDFLNA